MMPEIADGERIRHLRLDLLRLTQKAFADDLKVKVTLVSDVERGRTKLPCDMLEAIYRVYSVNPVWVLTGQKEVFLGDSREGVGAQHIDEIEPLEYEKFLDIVTEYAGVNKLLSILSAMGQPLGITSLDVSLTRLEDDGTTTTTTIPLKPIKTKTTDSSAE